MTPKNHARELKKLMGKYLNMPKKNDKPDDYDLFKSLERLSKQLQEEGYSLSPEELAYYKDSIDVKHVENKKFKDFENDVRNISNYLSEYLDTFIVLGYDLEGNRIVFRNHKDSSLKQDALFKLLEQTFIKFVQKHRGIEE